MATLKMYILVKDTIPAGKAIVGVAHASLACYLKYKEHDELNEWLSGPFYKTVCKVNDSEFENAKQLEEVVIIKESSLDSMETVLAFKPRVVYPTYFKYFQLYK